MSKVSCEVMDGTFSPQLVPQMRFQLLLARPIAHFITAAGCCCCCAGMNAYLPDVHSCSLFPVSAFPTTKSNLILTILFTPIIFQSQCCEIFPKGKTDFSRVSKTVPWYGDSFGKFTTQNHLYRARPSILWLAVNEKRVLSYPSFYAEFVYKLTNLF